MRPNGRTLRTQVSRQGESRRGDTTSSLDWNKILPFRTDAASDRLGWVGLQVARCRAEPAFERSVPALTHHRLVFVAQPPDELDLRYEGVKRHVPSSAGSITLVPAGSPVWALTAALVLRGGGGRRFLWTC